MPNHDLLLASIPGALRTLAQWVVWRYEVRAGRATKVPYRPRTSRRASVTDRSTWGSYEEAVEVYDRDGFAGVGFVFSEHDPFCGVDLDHCLGGNQEPSAEAARIVGLLNTYTEVSPSGAGLKLFLEGRVPSGGNRRGSVEMYDHSRFFTVTGRYFAGTPLTIEVRHVELAALHAEIFRRCEAPAPPRARGRACRDEDERLLARARSAKNGRRFMDLYYRGETAAYAGDDSAADLALCGQLAFWCGRDPARIDRLFRHSALMREKWDSRRRDTTYGALTIAKALGSPHG